MRRNCGSPTRVNMADSFEDHSVCRYTREMAALRIPHLFRVDPRRSRSPSSRASTKLLLIRAFEVWVADRDVMTDEPVSADRVGAAPEVRPG